MGRGTEDFKAADTRRDKRGDDGGDQAPAPKPKPPGGAARRAKEPSDEEKAELARLAFEDAAERAHHKANLIESFDGSSAALDELYFESSMEIWRIIEQALQLPIPDDRRGHLHASATRAAHNLLALYSLAPQDDSKQARHILDEMKSFLGPTWTAPKKVPRGTKRVDFDRDDAKRTVQNCLAAARGQLAAHNEQHAQTPRSDDIWGGANAYLTRAIEVLGGHELAKHREHFKRAVLDLRLEAVPLMNWAPAGSQSRQLRDDMNQLLVLVGEPQLPTVAAPVLQPTKAPGDRTLKETTATVADLESYRTAKDNAGGAYAAMFRERRDVVEMIYKESLAKDPKPRDFWGNLIKGLAMMALNIVTGGIGGALAGAVTKGLQDSALKGALGEALTNFAQGTLNAVADGALSDGAAGSPQTRKATEGLRGAYVSKDARAAYFYMQMSTLGKQQDKALESFREDVEPISVQAHFEPHSATAALQNMQAAMEAETPNIVDQQAGHTAAKWATYLAQTELGVVGDGDGQATVGSDGQLDFHKDDLARTGYRGTDMTDVATGEEREAILLTKHKARGDEYLEMKHVKGLVNLDIEGAADGSFRIVSARLPGLNKLMRERIETMPLKTAGIALRVHGMVRYDGSRDPIILTRNEQGHDNVNGFTDQSKAWLGLSGNGDHSAGAKNILDSLTRGSLADLNVKLGE